MQESLSFDLAALQPLLTRAFVLGVGTAAYQIEGAANTDGRTESVWDTFARLPGNIADHSTGDVACDHYHRWQEDLDLLVELGVDVYRFSVSWSRVIPDSSGKVNEHGMRFYRQLAEELRRHGIRPMVTLHHWDLPQYLQDRGGWQNRVTAKRFADYAKAVADGFGPSVDFYTTINEPWCIVELGHRSGIHAPGLSDTTAADAATHHLLLAHGLAAQELRDRVPRAEIGIVLNGGPSYPLAKSEADANAARLFDSMQIHRYAGPILDGEYPEEFTCQVAKYVEPGDLEIIAEPCDYLGWNYYSRNVVRAGEEGTPENVGSDEYPRTDMGWEIYPEGLQELFEVLHQNYKLPPLYISENGAAFKDEVADEIIHDRERFDYIERHLQVIAEMIESGIDIKGYVCWSLLDNFEWAEGYAKRFGLVHVDYETQKRTLKDSGKAFAELNAARASLVAQSSESRADVAP